MNKRVGDLEFRWTCSDRRPEIVAWETSDSPAFAESREYCYTLLWWTRGREGWSVEFVGSRPLVWAKENELKSLWNLIRYGDAVLAAEFALEEEE